MSARKPKPGVCDKCGRAVVQDQPIYCADGLDWGYRRWGHFRDFDGRLMGVRCFDCAEVEP